jgi:hypothetical protein
MTMTLHDYQQDVQRLLREQKQILANPTDLTRYINRARREVAMRSQAIRFLTPISGTILSCAVTDGGTLYTDPTVTISAPDFPSGDTLSPNGRQATAEATVQAGVIVGIDITDGGAGYFNPTITITDATTGTGAEAELTVGGINLLNAGQEQYKFSDIDLSSVPGAGSVYFVRSASILYNNYRYSLPCYPFSVYQSQVRQYPYQYQYVPTFFSQFGQGAGGTLFFYPLPSQEYQLELDCQLIPADLVTNQSVELLPEPWTDAVMYFAAHFFYLEAQNQNGAKGMLDLYERFAQRYSDYSRAGRIINPYGRW